MQTSDQSGPPPPFRQTSHCTIELREGGGRTALFGLPFFVVGVFLALTVVKKPTPPIPPLVSVAFLGVGSILLFGRRWLKLDFCTRSVVRETGLLIPMLRDERRLGEFSAVVLAFVPGDSDTPDRYRVRLRATSGKDFMISTSPKFSESRKQAEYLCRSLHLPLADATSDHETVISPERIGDALRDRLAASGPEEGPAPRPFGMRSEVRESAGVAGITIPGGKPAAVLAALIPLGVFLFLIPSVTGFFSRTETPRTMRMGILAFLVLVFGIPLTVAGVNLMVRGGRRRITVKASLTGLVIERRSAWRTRTEMLAAADILDIDYSTFEGALGPRVLPGGICAALTKWVPSKGIIVKTRQGVITFGEGLSVSELQYLTWVLRRALVAR